jgi:hypothetical protein
MKVLQDFVRLDRPVGSYRSVVTWTNGRLFVEVRLVATLIEIRFCARKSGLNSVLLEPKGATQEARFISYCRLLPPDKSLSY